MSEKTRTKSIITLFSSPSRKKISRDFVTFVNEKPEYMKKEINVCYIRIDDLYRNYFIAKHGSPAVFSPSSELASIVRNNLMDNPMMSAQSDGMHLSFSDLAFNYKTNGQAVDASVHLPSDEERRLFVSIAIPDEVHRFSGMVKTSPAWQLNRLGCRRFREAVKADFWREYRNFSNDCIVRSHLTGESVTTEDIISEFMTMFNIPMSLYENMLRYERRERASALSKIEKRRMQYEKQTGNRFLYT